MMADDQARLCPVSSPCVSVCALGLDDICIGCFRTGQEISSWGALSNEGRLEILRRVREREEQSGRCFSSD